MRLIDADKFKGKAICNHTYGGVLKIINIDDIPTAYDIDKVVKELEKNKRKLFSFAKDYDEVGNFEMAEIYSDRASEYVNAIEIVKQGCITKDCNNCANYTLPDKLDNCYLCCKGYEDNYEPKVDNGGVSDDVCEWRIVDRPNHLPIYNTSCGKIRLQYVTGVDIYCNGCGKKIKVVE